ncbi:MAG: FAD-binding oxidoreductase [Sphingobium sp.]
MREFAKVIGAEWVFSSDDDVALYEDSYTPFASEPDLQLHASAAVAPAKLEEVQEIVRIANRLKIPLYAISTGRNLGYGGSAPVSSGCVVVDLKRMNRVLEVNERAAYVLVEPGVSFMDLYQYLEANGHNLMVSPAEPGWGSPIGNALDHGNGMVAGDHFAMACGIEVVLASGEVLRTGMGAAPTSRVWQTYRYGFGPYIDGMFSQSNFGIVTKMGFWLIPKPERWTSFAVTSHRSEDLYPMVDAIQLMRAQGLVFSSIGGSPLRSANNATDGFVSQNISEARALLRKRDGGSHDEWNHLSQATKIPVSFVSGAVRGPAGVVAATLDHARAVFDKIPGTEFSEGTDYRFPLKPSEVDEEEKANLGIPSLWSFSRIAVQGTSHGHYYFSPMTNATAEDIFLVNNIVRNVLLDSGDNDLIDRMGWRAGLGAYPKSYTLLYEFLVTDDVELNRRRRTVFKKLVKECGAKGFGEYRAPSAFQDDVMGQYSNNNNVLRRFHETIKDAIDPNGILAPGKSGIWPKHMRSERRAGATKDAV